MSLSCTRVEKVKEKGNPERPTGELVSMVIMKKMVNGFQNSPNNPNMNTPMTIMKKVNLQVSLPTNPMMKQNSSPTIRKRKSRNGRPLYSMQ